MPGLPPALAAWLLLPIVLTGALSYVLLFRRDLVKGKHPPWLPALTGWLFGSVAVVLFVFLVLVATATS
jgi:hypothetical protein